MQLLVVRPPAHSGSTCISHQPIPKNRDSEQHWLIESQIGNGRYHNELFGCKSVKNDIGAIVNGDRDQ